LWWLFAASKLFLFRAWISQPRFPAHNPSECQGCRKAVLVNNNFKYCRWSQPPFSTAFQREHTNALSRVNRFCDLVTHFPSTHHLALCNQATVNHLPLTALLLGREERAPPSSIPTSLTTFPCLKNPSSPLGFHVHAVCLQKCHEQLPREHARPKKRVRLPRD
jgi:hypothetical protein